MPYTPPLEAIFLPVSVSFATFSPLYAHENKKVHIIFAAQLAVRPALRLSRRQRLKIRWKPPAGYRMLRRRLQAGILTLLKKPPRLSASY